MGWRLNIFVWNIWVQHLIIPTSYWKAGINFWHSRIHKGWSLFWNIFEWCMCLDLKYRLFLCENLAIVQGILSANGWVSLETTRHLPGQAPAPAWDAGSLEYLGVGGSQEVTPMPRWLDSGASLHRLLRMSMLHLHRGGWDMGYVEWWDMYVTALAAFKTVPIHWILASMIELGRIWVGFGTANPTKMNDTVL